MMPQSRESKSRAWRRRSFGKDYQSLTNISLASLEKEGIAAQKTTPGCISVFGMLSEAGRGFLNYCTTGRPSSACLSVFSDCSSGRRLLGLTGLSQLFTDACFLGDFAALGPVGLGHQWRPGGNLELFAVFPGRHLVLAFQVRS